MNFDIPPEVTKVLPGTLGSLVAMLWLKDTMWLLSVFCLGLTAILCVAGVAAPRHLYDDNPIQRLCLGTLCLGCCAGAYEISMTQFVANRWLLIHVPVALYATTVVYRVFKLRAQLARRAYVLAHHPELL